MVICFAEDTKGLKLIKWAENQTFESLKYKQNDMCSCLPERQKLALFIWEHKLTWY